MSYRYVNKNDEESLDVEIYRYWLFFPISSFLPLQQCTHSIFLGWISCYLIFTYCIDISHFNSTNWNVRRFFRQMSILCLKLELNEICLTCTIKSLHTSTSQQFHLLSLQHGEQLTIDSSHLCHLNFHFCTMCFFRQL